MLITRVCTLIAVCSSVNIEVTPLNWLYSGKYFRWNFLMVMTQHLILELLIQNFVEKLQNNDQLGISDVFLCTADMSFVAISACQKGGDRNLFVLQSFSSHTHNSLSRFNMFICFLLYSFYPAVSCRIRFSFFQFSQPVRFSLSATFSYHLNVFCVQTRRVEEREIKGGDSAAIFAKVQSQRTHVGIKMRATQPESDFVRRLLRGTNLIPNTFVHEIGVLIERIHSEYAFIYIFLFAPGTGRQPCNIRRFNDFWLLRMR